MGEKESIKKTDKNLKEIEHIAALLCGILSIVLASIWYLGLIHGITAIVCGIRSRKRFQSKMGLTGFILGIIGVVISTIFLILQIIIFFSESVSIY